MSKSEELFPRMISVNLGLQGAYEVTMDPTGERIVILRHGEKLQKVADFPAALVGPLVAFTDVYGVHAPPVSLEARSAQASTGYELFREGDETLQDCAKRLGVAPETLMQPPENDGAVVEHRKRQDGKVDTIVTPVGLQAGAKTEL